MPACADFRMQTDGGGFTPSSQNAGEWVAVRISPLLTIRDNGEGRVITGDHSL